MDIPGSYFESEGFKIFTTNQIIDLTQCFLSIKSDTVR